MNGSVVLKNREYSLWEKQTKMASEDVDRISAALKNAKEDELRDLHREMDAKYQSSIKKWGLSLYGYSQDFGTVSEMDVDSLVHNLKVMQEKIRAYSLGMNQISETEASNKTEVNLSVSNTVNVEVTFTEAKKKIENMNSLSRAETDEILSKINELENIYSEKISKKDKWARIKPIVAFAVDKGADVGIAILTLILQMHLGS